MQMTPVIAVHMTAALAALAIGPLAIWARRSRTTRPRLHRAAGYAWVTLMLMTALSAIFIRDRALPNIAGFSPIHLLVPVVLFSLFGAFRALARGQIDLHRKFMVSLYWSACVVAGAFTLLPQRFLGQLVWGHWLGLVPVGPPPPGAPALGQTVAKSLTQLAQGVPAWAWATAVTSLLVAGLIITLKAMRGRAGTLAQ